MAGSDGAILLATTRWADEQRYLHEVVKQNELPQLVRIVKGHYLNLGVPSLPNPNLSSTALVTSAGSCVRVAAQSVKFKDNHRIVNIGPKLAIPETFDGYFEILNEDGKAVRCIESVSELVRKFPDSCLVRENLKAYVSRSDNVDNIMDRSRTIFAGELLVLVGEVSGLTKTKGHCRFLRCFDSRGEHVYLPLDLRGKFSAIAKEDNISGVHNIRNLLNKRLPLMVRMVSGKPPSGLKLGQQFSYEMRLLTSFQEEIIVALPVMKDTSIAIIPPTVSLKLQLPVNGNNIKQSKEFLRVHDRCLQKYRDVMDHIQVYDANFSKNLRFDGQQWRVPVVPLLRRSLSDLHILDGNRKDNEENVTEMTPVAEEYDEIDQIYDYIRGFAPLPKHIRNSYDVINGNESGGQKRVDSNRNLYNRIGTKHAKKSSSSTALQKNTKPIPPPLETIPSRKKVSSPSGKTDRNSCSLQETSLPVDNLDQSSRISQNPDNHTVTIAVKASPVLPTKHAVHLRKSISQQETKEPVAKPRMYRQKSAMPFRTGHYKSHVTPALLSPAESKQSLTPSPLFNIRYKSMTNLLAADSDTLGSSQSGGRCSGGSAGSAAVRNPPHYLRQLSTPNPLHRPRSLTDLLWDVRSGKSPPKIQLHPTVVADVIPPARNHTRHSKGSDKSKQDPIIKRRNSANLLHASNNVSSKKHTIFYHL